MVRRSSALVRQAELDQSVGTALERHVNGANFDPDVTNSLRYMHLFRVRWGTRKRQIGMVGPMEENLAVQVGIAVVPSVDAAPSAR